MSRAALLLLAGMALLGAVFIAVAASGIQLFGAVTLGVNTTVPFPGDGRVAVPEWIPACGLLLASAVLVALAVRRGPSR